MNLNIIKILKVFLLKNSL